MKIQTASKLNKTLGTVGLIASLLVPTLLSAPAQAAPVAGASSAFGSVNVGRIEAESTRAADVKKQLQTLSDNFQQQFNVQQNSVMLSKDQQTRLGVLAAKTNRTDAETAELTGLQQSAAAAAQELTALQQKANPTDADKARLSTLTAQAQAGQQVLQDISAGYTAQLQAQQARLGGQLSDQVKAAISAVAQQRGLAVIFDSTLAIYSANDITDDVLKRLNGK